MRKTKLLKSFISLILAIGMIIALLPGMSITAKADEREINFYFADHVKDSKMVTVKVNGTVIPGNVTSVGEKYVITIELNDGYEQDTSTPSLKAEAEEVAANTTVHHTFNNINNNGEITLSSLHAGVNNIKLTVQNVKPKEYAYSINIKDSAGADRSSAFVHSLEDSTGNIITNSGSITHGEEYHFLINRDFSNPSNNYSIKSLSFKHGTSNESVTGPTVRWIRNSIICSGNITVDVTVEQTTRALFEVKGIKSNENYVVPVTTPSDTLRIDPNSQHNNRMEDEAVELNKNYVVTIAPPNGYTVISVPYKYTDKNGDAKSGNAALSNNNLTVTTPASVINDSSGRIEYTINLAPSGYVYISGGSNDNIKASKNPGSGNYYVSETNISGRSAIPAKSSSTLHAEPGKNFTFYLYDNSDKAVPNTTVVYRFDGDTADKTVTSNSSGLCTITVPGGNTKDIIIYKVSGSVVNVKYAGSADKDNKANVTTTIDSKSQALSSSAIQVPANKEFSFTVTPKAKTDGIKVSPAVKITVGKKEVTPAVTSRSIDSITYSIPASSMTGDVEIAKFTDIDEKQTVTFDGSIKDVTFATRDDGNDKMQPFDKGVLTLVKGDDAVVKVTPGKDYAIQNPALYDEKDAAIANVKYDKAKGLLTIPAASVRSGMTVKRMTGLIDAFPFRDVAEKGWSYDHIKFVYEEGVMAGTSKTEFSPGMKTSRGQIVTMLYSMYGKPDVTFKGTFPDVTKGQYYSNPVEWAALNKIAGGYTDGNYGPNDPVTRQDLALILYNYAKFCEKSLAATDNLSKFKDAASVSTYAHGALAWANDNGIIGGTENNEINPKGDATRAEVATMFHRYIEKFGKK